MMDLNIRELSESFSELLPSEKEKLSLNDIESSRIPYLVRKSIIHIVLERFNQSIGNFDSEWADLHSSRANSIWNAYLHQMRDLLHIPSLYIGEVLFEATEFTLRLAVQPRKIIITTLFREKESVFKDDIDILMDQFVANHHLLFSLSRYMEKKQKETLSREEAQNVLKKVDQKLTKSYNSLDWMEAVKPIFNVAGPSVPTDYIRLFFEDKEMPRVARKYDMMETDISETDFVELMSSADLLDMSGYEEEQPVLFTEETETTIENESDKTGGETASPVDEENENSAPDEQFSDREGADEEEAGYNELDEPSKEPVEEEPPLLQLFQDSDGEDESELVEQKDDSMGDEADTSADTEKPERDSESFDEDGENRINEIEERDEKPEETLEDGASDLSEFEKNKFEQKKDDFSNADHGLMQENIPHEEEMAEAEDDPLDDWNKEEVEKDSLLDQFSNVEDESVEANEPDTEQRDEMNVKSSSIYDELNLTPVEDDDLEDTTEVSEFEDDLDDAGIEDEIPFEPDDHKADLFSEHTEIEKDTSDELSNSGDDDHKDVPMWKSFLERENPDDEPSFYFDEGSGEGAGDTTDVDNDEEQNIEKSTTNLSNTEPGIEDDIEQLNEFLAPDRDRFIHEIFNDSKLAWEQSLIDLIVFDDWKSASSYLENEIFNKNRVDIYSEVAVDYTDYLHSYFMMYKY